MLIERGDGIGIELAHGVVRAVRISHDHSGIVAATELPLPDHDDHALLETFVRARAELGNAALPTRIATFPTGASMSRIDVTGHNGPELNLRRAVIARDHGATSTVLVDSGPRRWLYVLQWSASDPRRIEDLAERAGFLDAVVEPSPLALGRVFAATSTYAERSAAPGETFAVAFHDQLPVAAAAVEAVGRLSPALHVADGDYSLTMFDDLIDPVEVARHLVEVRGRQPDRELGLVLEGMPYPRFPQHDLRSAERQCVALGAAVGAAGLVGRLRPIDVVATDRRGAARQHPWAIEAVSGLEPVEAPTPPGTVRRLTSRLVPRRRR